MGGGEGAERAGGGGGGGGIRVEPLAVIEVDNDRLKVSPIVNVNRMGTLGILLVAWCVFWISRAIRATARARAAS